LESLLQHEPLACNIDARIERAATFGEKLANRLTEFVGSWPFLILFLGILLAWVGVNSFVLLVRPFDPYPYIFLNLVLSCMAAIQAPVIMMSQNRQDTRDRLRAEQAYRINLKSELEIRTLHEKLDHLLQRDWESWMEIRQLQSDLMSEVSRLRNEGRKG
jgi:uncharacterized membrane protein